MRILPTEVCQSRSEKLRKKDADARKKTLGLCNNLGLKSKLAETSMVRSRKEKFNCCGPFLEVEMSKKCR